MKTLALVVALLAAATGLAHGAAYTWLKPGESIDLVLCPHGRRVSEVRRAQKARFATNGGYFHNVRGHYVPIGLLYYHGREVFSFKAPPTRGWIYKDENGNIILSAFPPEDPKRCAWVIQCGSVVVEGGRAKSRCELALYGEDHIDRVTERNIIVLKDGRIGIYQATGSSLWKIAQQLEREGVDFALNCDGGTSTHPNERVANVFGFYTEDKTDEQEQDCRLEDSSIESLFPWLETSYPFEPIDLLPNSGND